MPRLTIQYADGPSAAGEVATDKVTVASWGVTKQGVGAVTKETGTSLIAPALGLGFTA
ncbi:hypothetical protein FRC01_009322, partial [Tulasnella sp. 417]